MVPGPGAYFVEGEGGEYNLANKSFPIEPARQFKQQEYDFKKEILDANKNQGIPGPAYYKNATKEPQKISFMFNPAEEWADGRAPRK